MKLGTNNKETFGVQSQYFYTFLNMHHLYAGVINLTLVIFVFQYISMIKHYVDRNDSKIVFTKFVTCIFGLNTNNSIDLSLELCCTVRVCHRFTKLVAN